MYIYIHIENSISVKEHICEIQYNNKLYKNNNDYSNNKNNNKGI